jgi:hypothetical protein
MAQHYLIFSNGMPGGAISAAGERYRPEMTSPFDLQMLN